MTDVRPRFDPVARRTISEGIREALLQSIRTGVLRPGDQLPAERAMSEEFAVARTSVREAVQGLVSLGLIEKRGNRTYVVEHLPDVELDGEDVRKRRVNELFEVRRIVEVPIARLAASRATESQRAEIAAIASGFHPRMGLPEFRSADRTFHWAVAQACDNHTLAEVYGKVLESLFRSDEFESLLSASSNQRVVRQVIQVATAGHQEIAEALVQGDADAVTQAAESHLQQVENLMIARMV